MADKDDEAKGEGKKKGGSKKLLIIIVAAVVVLIGGGAGAYFAFFAGSGTTDAHPEPTPSAVVVADAITVNLADGHYLKIAIGLQTTTNAAETVDTSKALDLVISQFSNLEVAELSTNKQREAEKAELTEKVVKAYTEEKKEYVMAVYFTEFVIQ
ncbi:flagellar basal body-associated FliL family protein [Cryptosporangium phraense]|uniref:Flagellar protein FliL n=1 Tax=Cryptosporangium phraense TaxID=2593070 RepID=A0A545AE75_9ACTN|nr:flagellar basal body-associated FliL family protein [Cryptosporangium phraense]TQS39560.1 flagellar basal body-associated protein FliL [Cryptosporangium phraense]